MLNANASAIVVLAADDAVAVSVVVASCDLVFVACIYVHILGVEYNPKRLDVV